ncbi:MAG: RNA polymerase sigma factor [bacterium]|nr:RNA polymerase sigma factor [bacterium]
MSARSSDAATATRLAWIREQQHSLWRYLRLLGVGKNEIEDLMQDAFLALFTNYAEQDPAEQVRLLRKIARNRFLDACRSNRRQAIEWSDAVDGWLAATMDRPLTDGYGDELDVCLGELSPRARAALTLHHVEGLAVEVVGERLELRKTGALTLLQRSRDLLRACLRRRGVPEPPKGQARRSHV